MSGHHYGGYAGKTGTLEMQRRIHQLTHVIGEQQRVAEKRNLQIKRLRAERTRLRKLVRDVHAAYVGAMNSYEGSESEIIYEVSYDTAKDINDLHVRCELDRHRFDALMQELGVEVG